MACSISCFKTHSLRPFGALKPLNYENSHFKASRLEANQIRSLLHRSLLETFGTLEPLNLEASSFEPLVFRASWLFPVPSIQDGRGGKEILKMLTRLPKDTF